MKIQEAIETLEIAKAEVEWNYPLNYYIAIEKAIENLKMQIPKKPTEEYIDIDTQAMEKHCPSCGYSDGCDFEDGYDRRYNFCPMCGQKLDWGGDEEWYR